MTPLPDDLPLDAECVALTEEILALRESPSPELQAKQLRLLLILGELRNQPLPADVCVSTAATGGTPSSQ